MIINLAMKNGNACLIVTDDGTTSMRRVEVPLTQVLDAVILEVNKGSLSTTAVFQVRARLDRLRNLIDGMLAPQSF